MGIKSGVSVAVTDNHIVAVRRAINGRDDRSGVSGNNGCSAGSSDVNTGVEAIFVENRMESGAEG